MNETARNLALRGPNALIQDYAAVALRKSAGALEHTVLRTRSLSLREVLAHLASDGRLGYEDVATGAETAWVTPWAAQLARVMAVQDLDNVDPQIPIRLLEATLPDLPRSNSMKYARVLGELYFRQENFSSLAQLLREMPELARVDFGYLRTDLINPFVGSPYANRDAWLESFGDIFTQHGLEAPNVDEAVTPFDGLCAPTRSEDEVDGPLVSVIMTTFRPDPASLMTSVQSILSQTWTNLELLIVDDASGDASEAVLTELETMDSRIRVLRQKTNQGTYMARNLALRAARGEFVTGQDADDWSHPRRIELQVAPLLRPEPALGTISFCVSATDTLQLQRLRPYTLRTNTSSMLVRRSDALKAGGFLPARRGADTEFLRRLELIHGEGITEVRVPLAIVRTGAETLSGSDFSPGWRHRSRWALRFAYEHWHETAEDLRINFPSTSEESPVPIPTRFKITAEPPKSYDVVYAGVWDQYGGPQRSMLEEIRAVLARGRRVGIMHLDAARFISSKVSALCRPIQELINDRKVDWILEDEVAHARLLVLRYPPILQFPPVQSIALKAEQVIVLANQAPAERDGTDIRYIPEECAENAQRLFGQRALWVPQGPTVRQALSGMLSADEVAPFDMPGLIDTTEWRCERESFRSDRPVIGRHSRDNLMKWPRERETLLCAYPSDGSVEVRIMGGDKAPRAILGDALPSSWLSFELNELDVKTFLNSLDFFVYFQNPIAFDAFGRAVLEALAAGCVAILPHHFEETFGDAAIYATEREVVKIVDQFYSDPDSYREQSELAVRRVEERYGYDAYVHLISSIIDQEATR